MGSLEVMCFCQHHRSDHTSEAGVGNVGLSPVNWGPFLEVLSGTFLHSKVPDVFISS